MRYLLTVLTNGRGEYLERSLAAFARFVLPPPEAIFAMDDAGATGRDLVGRLFADLFPLTPAEYESSAIMLGMCRAHAHCWHAAASSDLPWVFHLEDDFVILRPLELEALARTLHDQRHLAQMALVRTPWGREVEHGGYIPQSPGWYARVGSFGHSAGTRFAPGNIAGRSDAEWIETTRNWATCPALFRTSLAREFPWPLEDGCETAIGPAILERYPEARFGLWGWGEPWVAHVGVERQPGAYGY